MIASGANTDDLGDHRPGMRAAGENGVRHPLQECGLGKADVRALAKAWGLPTWDKPATPCLSSRIAYGEEVTPERVRMIDQAEQWLRQRGLRLLRVRYHKGDMARIEVPLDELPRLAQPRGPRRAGPGLPRPGLQVRHPRPRRVPLRQPQRPDPAGEPAGSGERQAVVGGRVDDRADVAWRRRGMEWNRQRTSPSSIGQGFQDGAGDLPVR